jgi:Pyridoxamine 5'-phosphate oxidase
MIDRSLFSPLPGQGEGTPKTIHRLRQGTVAGTSLVYRLCDNAVRCGKQINGHLRWPDYPGNRMFQTLGNLAVNPNAGLLFIGPPGAW